MFSDHWFKSQDCSVKYCVLRIITILCVICTVYEWFSYTCSRMDVSLVNWSPIVIAVSANPEIKRAKFSSSFLHYLHFAHFVFSAINHDCVHKSSWNLGTHIELPTLGKSLQQIWFNSDDELYSCENNIFCQYTYSWCGELASWATQHTTMCLDAYKMGFAAHCMLQNP